LSNSGELHEVSVSFILRRSWTILWKKPAAFLGITLLFSIAWTVEGILFENLKWYKVMTGMEICASVAGIISFILLSYILRGVVLHVAFMLLTKGSAFMLESFRHSVKKVLSVINGVFIVFTIYILVIIGGGVLMNALVGFSFGILFDVESVQSITLLIIFVLITIIFTIFEIKWFVFFPACVIEDADGFDSLKRSSALTKGYRLKVLIMLILTGVVMIIPATLIIYAKYLIPESEISDFILPELIMLIPCAYTSIMLSVAYYNLRIVKENEPLNDMADLPVDMIEAQ
jgi:hypothetical protein